MRNSGVALARQYPAAGLAVLAGVALAMAAIATALPPIAQPQAYHAFADQQVILGIPHFGDVVSNLAYAIVALAGFAFLLSRAGRATLAGAADRLPYIVFFAAVAAIAAGSASYHVDPTNETLLWDRLPMTVAFTAILAAFVADRVHGPAGAFVVLPLAVALGVASLVYWHLSEAAGAGDLRAYFLVQAFAFVLVPLICVLFRGHHTDGKFVGYILALYGLAVACEQLDGRIYEALGGALSGHTMKHLLSALAIYMVVAMLHRSARTQAANLSC